MLKPQAKLIKEVQEKKQMDQLLIGYETLWHCLMYLYYIVYILQEGLKELKGMMKYDYDIFCGSMGKKKYLLKQTGSMRRCFDG